VIVGKYGHTIVERNRLRRRLRELARIRLLPGCNGVDIVIRPLAEAYRVDFRQLGIEIDEIKRGLRLIVPQV
jgi:ribonuclease P protein component